MLRMLVSMFVYASVVLVIVLVGLTLVLVLLLFFFFSVVISNSVSWCYVSISARCIIV